MSRTQVVAAALLGREDDLARIEKLLADDSTRLVSLTGRGGIGKTRLALELARRLDPARSGATVVVDLSHVRSPDLFLSEVAAALHMNEAGADEQLLGSIAARLGTVELLVLDNMEQLRGATPTVATLFDRCPDLRILVTTQSSLGLPAEQVVLIGPLSVPPEAQASLETTADTASVALYCERASARQGGFVLDRSNVEAVAALCRELEGLPLAIELAAARSDTMAIEDLLSRLAKSRLELLRAPRSRAPRRRSDLAAAISWSYNLVSSAQRRLLSWLSVLAGPFDLDDVEAIAPTGRHRAVDDLSALVDVHLVTRRAGPGRARFEIPPSIAEFAEGRLTPDQVVAATDRRLARAVAQAMAIADGLDTLEQQRWLDEAAERRSELTDCLRICADTGRAAEATVLVSALAEYWYLTGYHGPQRRLVDEVIALAARSGLRDAYTARAMLWAGHLAIRSGRPDDRRAATELFVAGEGLARELDDPAVLVRALSFQLTNGPVTRDSDRSGSLAAEGLALAEASGLELWAARFEVWNGMLAHQLGDEERAIAFGRRGLRRARAAGDARATVLAVLLLYPLSSGRPELASELPSLGETRELALRTGQLMTAVLITLWLATDACAEGRLPQAIHWCAAGLDEVCRSAFPYAPYGILTATQVLATHGDLAGAARLQGVIADDWQALSATMPPRLAAAHERIMRKVENTMGAERYRSAVASTRHWSLMEGATKALEHIRRLEEDRELAGLADARPPAVTLPLTPRQTDVLVLIANGLSNKEIGARLSMAPGTVRNHTTELYQRLGVRSRSEATAWAMRSGLLT